MSERRERHEDRESRDVHVRHRDDEAPRAAAGGRRFEPWPWIIAALLLGMITTSLNFYRIAADNPDPEVRAPASALRTASETAPPEATSSR
jgi:hypothetical protein